MELISFGLNVIGHGQRFESIFLPLAKYLEMYNEGPSFEPVNEILLLSSPKLV